MFNPFAEASIASRAFTPVKTQALLAKDLATLPQFLCQPGDIVLVPEQPSAHFLHGLEQAGFPLPEFVALSAGTIDPANDLAHRTLGQLRPWAWGPDSVKLLEPLFSQRTKDGRAAADCFNDDIATLYSKAWSAAFLRAFLTQRRDRQRAADPWLCSEQEAGLAVRTLQEALEAVAGIRGRGHHRVVVKQAYGLAGHNAIRLWEPEILPTQRRHIARALESGQPLIVEPWLDRALDFSVQLERTAGGLELCGYTGLVNDRKGQFLANWAEPPHRQCLPAKVAALLGAKADVSEQLERLYREIFVLLEAALRQAGFVGPISIDAFLYRTPDGDCRLKPVVEINPRYTMGRLTLELMKHASPGSCGRFRLVSRAQARAEGFETLVSYHQALTESRPLILAAPPGRRIGQGALCLTDPERAQVCLATFEVGPAVGGDWIGTRERQERQ